MTFDQMLSTIRKLSSQSSISVAHVDLLDDINNIWNLAFSTFQDVTFAALLTFARRNLALFGKSDATITPLLDL